MLQLRIAAAAAAGLAAAARQVTVRNDVPRVDQFGHIVNAHDGSVVFFDGLYYMYGTVYENCTQPGSQCAAPCGYSPNTFALSVDHAMVLPAATLTPSGPTAPEYATPPTVSASTAASVSNARTASFPAYTDVAAQVSELP